MNATASLLAELARHEWRLRVRRPSSLVVLGLVIAATWLMIPDPSGHTTLFAVREQRMAYDSSTLAVGGGLLVNLLFGLLSFFLARGRSQQELQCGVSPLLACAPLSGRWLLLGRWLGALAFLMSLAGLALLTLAVLQLLRGEGPLLPGPYLAMWLFGLGPTLLLGASMALVCDAWAPLLGRRGDLLFYAVWIGQFATLPLTLGEGTPALQPLQALDVSGMSALVTRLAQLLGTNSVSIGGSTFNPALGVGHLPDGVWTWPLVSLRLMSALLAMLPLVPALMLFHRYNPDLVKPGTVRAGSRWKRWGQAALRPLARGVGRLLPLCARLPGWPGQVLADACLALIGQPLALLMWPVFAVLGMTLPAAQLGALMMAVAAVWGLLICGLGAQDHQAGTLALTQSMPGGGERRQWRPVATALLLGLLLSSPVLVRWSTQAPLQALALLSGLLLLSGLAAGLGHWTRGARTFLALFLFWLYAATQVTVVSWLDVLGFNGQARPATVLVYGLLGLACLAGLRWQPASH